MIQTEVTPNPDSLKFLSDKTISAIGTEEFQSKKKNEVKNLFIKELLGFKGVELILLSEKFLSVKKTKEVSWYELKPMIISHLNDYFEKNNDPILAKKEKFNHNIKNDLYLKLETLIINKKIRRKFGKAGREFIIKNFKEDDVINFQLEFIYKNIL